MYDLKPNSSGPMMCLGVLVVTLALAGMVVQAGAETSERSVSLSEIFHDIEVGVGKTVLIQSQKKVSRVTVGDDKIASVKVLSPKELCITGKILGTTTMSIWGPGQAVEVVYDVHVQVDTIAIKRNLHKQFPMETRLQVTANRDRLILSGKVSDAQTMSNVMTFLQAYVPKEHIQNLASVGGVHQVQLKVRVSEIARTVTNRLGVNWSYSDSENLGMGMIGKLVNLPSPGESDLRVADAVNGLYQFNNGSFSVSAWIQALRENGLVKILAEPNLISQSGKQADFLAGGEYPIPVPQGLGTVAIEYKTFGVYLKFTPVVLSSERIAVEVTTEVSELDFSTARTVEGFLIPGLTTRKTTTSIELRHGQSFVISGLIRDNARDRVSKYPFLGEIPVLGNLFKSREFQSDETELMVIVTPELVAPIDDAREIFLPTDYYVAPNYAQFFILGSEYGKLPKQKTLPPISDSSNEYGHLLPATD